MAATSATIPALTATPIPSAPASEEHVTINIDEVDGKKNGESPKSEKLKQNGHSPHHRRDSGDHTHHGHRNHSYHHHSSGSESDTEDDDDDDHHHRKHRSHKHQHTRRRSISSERHHSPARRARRNTDDTPTKSPRTERDLQSAIDDAEPLLETDLIPKRTATNPELEDDPPDETIPNNPEYHPGVDDGFFTSTTPPTTTSDSDGHERRSDSDDRSVEKSNPNPNPNGNGGGPTLGGPTTFPFAPGLNPSVILDANGNPQVYPDINVYQQKKNLAQGMMDLALLSANANQLRYVLESYPRHPYYWFSAISITVSLFLQIAVGVGLILNSRYNVKNRDQICVADRINNFTVIGIFLITIVNVFIAAFGVADTPVSPGQ